MKLCLIYYVVKNSAWLKQIVLKLRIRWERKSASRYKFHSAGDRVIYWNHNANDNILIAIFESLLYLWLAVPWTSLAVKMLKISSLNIHTRSIKNIITNCMSKKVARLLRNKSPYIRFIEVLSTTSFLRVFFRISFPSFAACRAEQRPRATEWLLLIRTLRTVAGCTNLCCKFIYVKSTPEAFSYQKAIMLMVRVVSCVVGNFCHSRVVAPRHN